MPPLRNHVAHVVLAALLFVLGVAAASGAKLPALGKSPRASKPPTAVTQKSRLHWDGKIFTSKHRFRGYLVSRGVNWRNFAQFHPAAIRLLQNGKCRSVKNCGAPAGTTTTAPPAPTTTSAGTTTTAPTTTSAPTTNSTTTTATTTTTTAAASTSTYYDGDAPWNTRIGSGTGVRSQSSTWVSQLYGAVSQINVNQGSWTPGIFYADASTPRATWTLPNGWVIDNAPVPSNLQASEDADAHAVIVDTARGLEYDFFGLQRSSSSPSGWTASAGVVGRLGGSGWWNNSLGPWGARASGAELLGGLILKTDVTSGSINHALACAAPKSLIAGSAVSPATTSDGSGASSAMPMGSRLQLDPSLDLSSLPLESGEAMVARALQQYGCYVVDSSSGLVLYAQNFTALPGGANPYPSSWSNGISKELVKHMRVLDPPATPTFDDRTSIGQPHK